MFKSNGSKLMVLTLVHFAVDFCGGTTIPLPEPTLTRHLGVGLAEVAVLAGGLGLLVNAIQPLSGLFLPKRGAPLLLGLAPLAAAVITCIGLTDSFWGVAVMMGVAGVGIGVVHPEAALAAHSLSAGRRGLGMSLFMSGGYFGFACGSLVSGVWLETHSPGLTRFWLLGLPAVLIAALVFASGLHRIEGHMGDDPPGPANGPSFGLALLLCVLIALNMCLLVRFIPIFLVRTFPGQGGQGWGGATVFATGITGAAGAFLWGHFSEGRARGLFIAAAQCLALPFLFLLLRTPSPALGPVWGLGLGATMGGVFPLSVVVARSSGGRHARLRMGLAIGGAWGMGEVAFILGGRYVGAFPADAAAPVVRVMSLCAVLLAVTVAVALWVGRTERRVR